MKNYKSLFILIGLIGLSIFSCNVAKADEMSLNMESSQKASLVPMVLGEDSDEDGNASVEDDASFDVGFVSPIKHPTLMKLMEHLVRLLFWLGITGMTLVVLYGAYLMITSGGDPTKFAKGQKAITYAVLGLILILLSWAIVAIIRSVLSAS